MAIKSAVSINCHNSQYLPIIIYTDAEFIGQLSSNIKLELIDQNQLSVDKDLNPAFKVAYLKTQLLKLSPFETTLYLDSDILAVKDISSIWDFVDTGLCLAPAFSPLIENNLNSDEEIKTYQMLVAANNLHQFNGGVIMFRKNKPVTSFFEHWAQAWEEFREGENMALTRCLISNPINVNQLPAKYNEFYPWQNPQSILVHYIGVYKHYLGK
ncbi:MAG: glycosyltransferase [Waterburya sp.]